MEKASYANKNGQRRIQVAGWALGVFCAGLLVFGLIFDADGKLNLLSRMGSVVVASVIAFFLVMEVTGYLTGESSDDVFNPNHGKQRSYLARFEGPLLVAGTLISATGDWLTNLVICGGFKC